MTDREVIESFKYRENDCIICSYPKSGSTWLRFLVARYFYIKSVDFSGAQRYVPALSSEGLKYAYKEFHNLKSPRFLRSHFLYNSYFPKIIYLVRDFRDVIISYYYHHKKMNGSINISLKDFYNSFDFNSWSSHVISWLGSDTEKFIVRYEDLLKDPCLWLSRIIRYSGEEPNSELVRETVEDCSFDNMRKIEDKKGLGYLGKLPTKNGFFVRKGKCGQWVDELPFLNGKDLPENITKAIEMINLKIGENCE